MRNEQKAILLIISTNEYQLVKVSHKQHLLMGKAKELSQDLHNLIVAKRPDGIGYRRISKSLNVTEGTVGATTWEICHQQLQFLTDE